MQHTLVECDEAESRLPAMRQASSHDLRWTSVLARSYREKAETDEFTTRPTTNLLVVLVTGGVYNIESRRGSRWRTGVYRQGSVGITAPGNASTLRWRTLGNEPMTSLHLYLDPSLFTDTVTGNALDGLPDALTADDPTVVAVGRALHWALDTKAPATYADSAAQFLAAHLSMRHPKASTDTSVKPLGNRALSDVVAFMHAHLADHITLDMLSAAARLSKYHFLRAFKASTGVTPHQFLVELRMHHGAKLLRTTPSSVGWVAAQCGYRNHGHFATAFRGQYGVSPAGFRKATAEPATTGRFTAI